MRPRLTLQQVESQALAVRANPPRTLPASWWDQGVAERMSDWHKRNAPRTLARRFNSRRSA